MHKVRGENEMNKTKIEWCDMTWNPVTGCLHGCEYCYARRIANRFSYTKDWNAYTANLELDKPIIDAVTGKATAYPHGFAPTLYRYRLNEPQRVKEPRTIFVCSMADLFGDWVPDNWIEEVFAACEKAPQHTYLFLTKNPNRYKELALAKKLPIRDNMWYGTTATEQSEKSFFYSGAWHTFVSLEPVLREYSEAEIRHICDLFTWVIVGAETGNRKDKVIPKKKWIETIMAACFEKDAFLFMKDSLIPIMGEKDMFREFPWEKREQFKANINKEIEWLDRWYERQEALGNDKR